MPHTSPAQRTPLTPDQRNAFLAALLGWMMDAFDYFIVIFVYADIAAEFRVSLTQMAFVTAATLLMRPVGALLFGLWADRVGRRVPVLVDVAFYSIVGFLCAFAPNFTVLFILRLLYGIGMGGEWGLGAALAMEKIPAQRCGFFSGILQQGYALGYLLASVATLLVVNLGGLGWRWLFALSILPAFVSLLIRSRLSESEVWADTREHMRATNTSVKSVLMNKAVLRRFSYLVVLMTAFCWLSHGPQDIYPTFLKSTDHGGTGLSASTTTTIAIIFNFGALIGGFVFGSLSPTLRPPLHRRVLRGAGPARAADLRLLHHGRHGLPRRVPHADRHPGHLVDHPGPPDRDVPAVHPRPLPRRHLPAR
ncbi:MFS transporter [Kutzneria chonburiensis]|uniref:MFS transporter n=1 Tax=Kutzneria chonburiensis TaxID=1483604 RepID=A0ABV6MNR2_9PSEU